MVWNLLLFTEVLCNDDITWASVLLESSWSFANLLSLCFVQQTLFSHAQPSQLSLFHDVRCRCILYLLVGHHGHNRNHGQEVQHSLARRCQRNLILLLSHHTQVASIFQAWLFPENNSQTTSVQTVSPWLSQPKLLRILSIHSQRRRRLQRSIWSSAWFVTHSST